MRQKMGAKLIAAGTILEMSSVELQSRISEELATNPALEILEDMVCPVCRHPLRDGDCPNCGLSRAERYNPEVWLATLDDRPPAQQAETVDQEREDLYSRVEFPMTLREHLRLQARIAVSKSDYPTAEYLIDNVDEKGLLDCDLDEVAGVLGVDRSCVDRVLQMLQSLDPPGVASTSSQQGLLIQLAQLADQGITDQHAETIIKDHWRDLADHAYSKIAKALRVAPEVVDKSVEFIRHNLDPYPGRQFRVSWQNRPRSADAIQRPDAIIRRQGADYAVEVVESPDFVLRVSESYRRLHKMLMRQSGSDSQGTWRQAIDQLRRADWFIQSIRMRRRTLQEVTEAVVEIQRPFLDTGLQEKLRPLTRAKVSQALGKHESTISRATANKYVFLPSPSNRVVGFDFFFKPSLSPKSIIEDIIRRESAERPLTDMQICQLLATRGFSVARRTVAKYRLALRIPSSEQRGRR